jgi:hypothetical protein
VIARPLLSDLIDDPALDVGVVEGSVSGVERSTVDAV